MAEIYYPTLQKTIAAHRRMHRHICDELHDALTTSYLTCCNSWRPDRGSFFGHWTQHVRSARQQVARKQARRDGMRSVGLGLTDDDATTTPRDWYADDG